MVRGIGRYVLEHSRALVERHGDRIDGVVIDRGEPLPPRMSWLRGHRQVRDAEDRRGGPPGLYHVMSAFEPPVAFHRLWPAPARSPETRLVVTLYDLIPKVVPGYELTGWRRTRYEARLQLVGRADHLVCLSEVTAHDAQRLFGTPDDRITVIGGGISVALDFEMSADHAYDILGRSFPGLQAGHVLYVGAGDPRKNLPRMIEAWARVDAHVRAGRSLVIAGPATPDRLEQLDAIANAAGLKPGDLRQTGYISDEELSALYVTCGVFAFPSTYEGYGLPILEAMAFGVPVIAARASTSSEVLGDTEFTFDPHDTADMASVIQVALTDDRARASMKRRSRQRSQDLTWGRVADLTIEAYDVALARRSFTRAD
jgi:glycosyltransferase involved in cell wall biosynthesis